jgi:transcriptional regulator with XRE-family HTH domain
MNFYERIKNAREDRDISQKDMATMLDMNQSNYSRIETGHQEPSLDQLMKMAEIFQLTIDELLGVDSDKYLKSRIKDFNKIVEEDYNKNFGK